MYPLTPRRRAAATVALTTEAASSMTTGVDSLWLVGAPAEPPATAMSCAAAARTCRGADQACAGGSVSEPSSTSMEPEPGAAAGVRPAPAGCATPSRSSEKSKMTACLFRKTSPSTQRSPAAAPMESPGLPRPPASSLRVELTRVPAQVRSCALSCFPSGRVARVVCRRIFPPASRTTSLSHLVPSPRTSTIVSVTTPLPGIPLPLPASVIPGSKFRGSVRLPRAVRFLSRALMGSGKDTALNGALLWFIAIPGSPPMMGPGAKGMRNGPPKGIPNGPASPTWPGPKSGAPRRPKGSSVLLETGRCCTCSTHTSRARASSKRSSGAILKLWRWPTSSVSSICTPTRSSSRTAQSQTTTFPALRSTPQCLSNLGTSCRTKGMYLRGGTRRKDVPVSIIACALLPAILAATTQDVCGFSMGDQTMDPGCTSASGTTPTARRGCPARGPGATVKTDLWRTCGRRW
mmetsp:Transcript_94773/g.305955  ORF Transcript_94773/g.305955 Transcript_94773/m.305955 type:complete len:462 (-) Transcript_94773:611-1996(-)